jgi:hypothetical protein
MSRPPSVSLKRSSFSSDADRATYQAAAKPARIGVARPHNKLNLTLTQIEDAFRQSMIMHGGSLGAFCRSISTACAACLIA